MHRYLIKIEHHSQQQCTSYAFLLKGTHLQISIGLQVHLHSMAIPHTLSDVAIVMYSTSFLFQVVGGVRELARKHHCSAAYTIMRGVAEYCRRWEKKITK